MTTEIDWHSTESRDSGSLKTAGEKLAVGDTIQIEGESTIRRVTHVMGSEKKGWFATFRGQGAVPQGVLRWRVVDRGNSVESQDGKEDPERHAGAPSDSEMVESEKIKIARITARQAIIVALITAASGVLVGLLSGYRSGKSAQIDTVQRWITVKPVVAEPYTSGSAVRVIAMVNSQAYSYPSRAVWADIGPRMSKESFPLPVGADEFRFRFEVFYRGPNGEITAYTSQEVDEIKSSELSGSVERTYSIFPLDRTFTRGAQRVDQSSTRLTVVYEVR